MEEGDTLPVTAKLRASRRRRPRASRACETCRIRKTKCDQAQPCSYCAYHSLDCIYRNASSNSNAYPAAKRLGQIREVQRDISRPSPWPEVGHDGQKSLNQQRNSPGQLAGEAARTPQYPTRISASSPIVYTRKQDSNSMIVSPGFCDSASGDGLSGVNLHTNGTEFYGTSSNFAFLQTLYARAHNQSDVRSTHVSGYGAPVWLDNTASPLDPAQAPAAIREGGSTQSTTNKAPLSIVNLLYNPNYPSQSPPQLSGISNADKDTRDLSNSPNSSTKPSAELDNGLAPGISQLSDGQKIEIEKLFVRSYFANKHYIHPMLCKNSFMQRCDHEAFDPSKRPKFYRGSSKFSGLYFAVVALGAINASPNEIAFLENYYDSLSIHTSASIFKKPSSLDFADFYFGIAKQALGDLFESCSLESVQALLVLSVFCQNALRPHNCYMYSGMAVRTAVAIGLASGISSLSPAIRKEGIRTWWCIYSHEVEMCCSSGRLNSVKDLSYYQVPLPIFRAKCLNQQDPGVENNDIAMIPVMVDLARIMSEASHLLYHSPKRATREMSQIAMNLDDKLLMWKSELPSFLNIDVASLNDPEWAFKQKLVLRLRFYNTRILIHRPFLAVSTSNTDASFWLQHVHTCLSAARTSIQMQYEAFLHRPYIRTWWYNTTYALYAAMILLHLVLSGFPRIEDRELLADVEKSLDIFESMNNIIVARRCSEMIREVLELARACAARRKAHSSPTGPPPPQDPTEAFGVEPELSLNNNATNTTAIAPSGIDGNFFFSLFNQDSQPDTRANILANLVDPTILEDFAFGNDSPFFIDP